MKKLVFFLAFCLSPLAFRLSPTAQAQFNTDRLTAIGRNALYFDDYVVSIQYFNQVIKLKPYLYEPYLLRAIAKIQLSDYQGALQDLNTTIARNPFQPGAFYTRGYVYRQMGDYVAAEKDFNDALVFSPENKTYLILRADVLSQQQRYDQAMADIDFLLRKEPRSPNLLFEKGVICMQKQDTACAHDYFTQTTLVDSRNPGNWSALGVVDMMLHRDSDAYRHLSQAINLGSKWAGDYMNRGIVAYHMNNYRGAVADYDKAVELAPKDPQCIYNRGILRHELGDKNRALQDFNKAISLNPEQVEMRYNRAVTLIELQQWQEAIADLQTLRARYPNFLPAYSLEAQAQTALGHTQQAYALRQEALEREQHRNDPTYVHQGADTLAPNTDMQIAKAQTQRRDRRKEFSARAAENQDEPLTDEDQAYDSNTRGSIQNKNVAVMNEPNITLSYYRPTSSLRQTHYDHYCVDEFNRLYLLPSPLRLTRDDQTLTADLVNYHFEQINRLTIRLQSVAELDLTHQAALYFSRAMEFALVQDYVSAIDDCTQAILRQPNWIFMYFARATWRYKIIEYQRISGGEKTEMDFEIMFREYDYITSKQPDFAFAYYNKANVLCLQREWEDAIRNYTLAIAIDDDFAEAYFNRGLTYIYTDRIEEGIRDLSKAGELGIYQAYNLITRFQ